MEAVHDFVGRFMAGYDRAGVNNDQVARTKLSKRVIPLEAWSKASSSSSSSATSSSSASTSSSSSSSSFQSAIRREKDLPTCPDYFVAPVLRRNASSSNSNSSSSSSSLLQHSKKRSRTNSTGKINVQYSQAHLILHSSWLRYYKEATKGLNGPRLRRIVGVTLNLSGAQVIVAFMSKNTTTFHSKHRKMKRRKKIKMTKERTKEKKQTLTEAKVLAGGIVGRKGIVLTEQLNSYMIVLEQTGKIVRVLKQGTILEVLVDNNLNFEISRSS
jgi:hypothetical protein